MPLTIIMRRLLPAAAAITLIADAATLMPRAPLFFRAMLLLFSLAPPYAICCHFAAIAALDTLPPRSRLMPMHAAASHRYRAAALARLIACRYFDVSCFSPSSLMLFFFHFFDLRCFFR